MTETGVADFGVVRVLRYSCIYDNDLKLEHRLDRDGGQMKTANLDNFDAIHEEVAKVMEKAPLAETYDVIQLSVWLRGLYNVCSVYPHP